VKGKQQTSALEKEQSRILRDEEMRAREERISAIRERVQQRNAFLLRQFGVRGSSAPSAPTALGGAGSWLRGGWRMTTAGRR
jgi:hypothetical protein